MKRKIFINAFILNIIFFALECPVNIIRRYYHDSIGSLGNCKSRFNLAGRKVSRYQQSSQLS